MQAKSDDCGVDPAAVWWNKQRGWPAEMRDAFVAPMREPNIPLTVVFAALGVFFWVFAPVAWLYAREQRLLVRSRDLRDVGRPWLIACEVIGACVTLVMVALFLVLLIAMFVSVGSGASR